MGKCVPFNQLQGKILVDVGVLDDSIHFETSTGKQYDLYHNQSCCENVYVEDVNGDLEDICGHTILLAEESSNSDGESEADSFTWTFFKLSTIKGSVVIRFYGESNGYYGESADLHEVV